MKINEFGEVGEFLKKIHMNEPQVGRVGELGKLWSRGMHEN